MEEQQSVNKSIKGYKVIIIILAIILAALSYLYFQQVNQLKTEYQVERDTLNNRIENLMDDYDNIIAINDTITQSLAVERGKADSLMLRLNRERNLNRQKVREYEKELGTLREVMRGFVKQIDSLNRLNTSLISENVEIRRQASEERLRADMAEEKADELGTKIRRGAVIRARDINLLPVSSSDKVTTRASAAARLRVDFVLSANELSRPGERYVYVRITGPDGYIMSVDAGNVFSFEGDKITYSAARQVDYQNQDLSVSLYYNGSGITSGKYKVDIYMDGYRIGSGEVILR